MSDNIAFYAGDRPVLEEEFYDAETQTPKVFVHENPNKPSQSISHIPYIWNELPYDPGLLRHRSDGGGPYMRNKNFVYDTLFNIEKDIAPNHLTELFSQEMMGYSSSYIRSFAVDEDNGQRMFTTGVCDLPTSRPIDGYFGHPVGKYNHRWGVFGDYKPDNDRKFLKNMDDQVGTMIHCHLAKKRYDVLMITREKSFTFRHQINNEPYYARSSGWEYTGEPIELYHNGVFYYVMYWYNQEKYTSDEALDLIKYYASP